MLGAGYRDIAAVAMRYHRCNRCCWQRSERHDNECRVHVMAYGGWLRTDRY